MSLAIGDFKGKQDLFCYFFCEENWNRIAYLQLKFPFSIAAKNPIIGESLQSCVFADCKRPDMVSRYSPKPCM